MYVPLGKINLLKCPQDQISIFKARLKSLVMIERKSCRDIKPFSTVTPHKRQPWLRSKNHALLMYSFKGSIYDIHSEPFSASLSAENTLDSSYKQLTVPVQKHGTWSTQLESSIIGHTDTSHSDQKLYKPSVLHRILRSLYTLHQYFNISEILMFVDEPIGWQTLGNCSDDSPLLLHTESQRFPL